MPKAATFSGTRNTPRSTTAAPTCSSRAPGWRTPSASASRAATIRKRSAARRNGSPSGSTKLYQPGERHEQTLADGRVILIEERLTEDGGVIGLRVDITELKQREASFRLLFDSNPVPMIVCALDDERILGVNDAAIAALRLQPRSEFEKLTIRSLQAFETELPWGGDRTSDEQAARTWKHVRADGALIDLAIYSRQLVYDDQPAMLLALMDITERKRAEARLAFMAQHDGLTGLPNRNLLRQQMDDILLHTRRSAREGRGAGARPRQFQGGQRYARPWHRRQAAARRRASACDRSLREEDVLARLNSDEFAIVQSGLTRPEDAVLLARRLLEAIGDPYLLDGHSVVIGASIGIAMAPGDGDESEKLLKNADLALSRAKNDSRGTFSLLRGRHGRARPGAPQDRDRSARRDPERRAAAALPAAGRPRDRAHHRLRGAGALAASGARHDLAGRIHSGRRGDRPDQRARRA